MEMKKFVAGLSVSVMAIGALAACGGGSDSESSSSDSGSKKPSKIVIWEDTEKAETTKAAAKAFEEKEGVKVCHISICSNIFIFCIFPCKVSIYVL